jgi:hypothetical protein
MADRAPVAIDGFLIDATLSETHEHPSKVTEFPVEKGIDIADNIRPEPIKITLECVVSDTPLGRVKQARESAAQAGGAVSSDPPSMQAYKKLIAIRDKREPVLVQTSLKDFPSMALENVSVPRKSGEPDQLMFTVTLVQIEVVENARRTVQVAAPKQSLGNRSPGVRFINTIVWRVHGEFGDFVENRYVLLGQKPSGKWGYFLGVTPVAYHGGGAGSIKPGRELTPAEQKQFNDDFNLDHKQVDDTGLMQQSWAQQQANSVLLPPQDPTRSNPSTFMPYPNRRF